ncbi:DUF4870 domain-containing protein [Actinoplanes couchii]|uniref:DUF4870 domain-containing protein n=1 Tax=Actinoplanes couchii TaxID=403638 RepID=A0ABQ3XQD5_9ACTN|nr:DUF4870 domain-containing protein [Actinoplanes couchii]MDR6323046.1 putative Tic20 family protein [Actinoplanes couchii]GID60719.1 hypothetical protein Aco03nite_091230 [Actinoplanes couchii]
MTTPPRPPDDDPTTPYNTPGGYQSPPPGGYPPPPPYGPPPGYGPPPQQYGSSEDRMWVMVAHFGGAAAAFFGAVWLGWIPPLVAYLSRGQQSPFVRAESLKALNFQLLWTIVGVIGYALICAGLGFIIVGLAVLIATIFGVIAGIKALNNEPYHYPLTYPFVK